MDWGLGVGCLSEPVNDLNSIVLLLLLLLNSKYLPKESWIELPLFVLWVLVNFLESLGKNIWFNFYIWYEQSSEWKTINTVNFRDWKFEGRNHTVFSVNVCQLCKVAINMNLIFFIRISQVNQRKNLYCVLSKCRSVVGGCHWYEFWIAQRRLQQSVTWKSTPSSYFTIFANFETDFKIILKTKFASLRLDRSGIWKSTQTSK